MDDALAQRMKPYFNLSLEIPDDVLAEWIVSKLGCSKNDALAQRMMP
jgi:hypothetical protein